MNGLKIRVILEDDEKTINFVEISGCTHDMYSESDEEKDRYQKMTVEEFIAEYVEYYHSAEEN